MAFLRRLKAVLLGDSGGSESPPPAGRPGLRFTNPRSPDGPHVVLFDRLVKRQDGALVLILLLSGSGPEARERLTLALDAIEQNREALAEVHMTQADFAILDSFFGELSASHRSAFQRTDVIVVDAPSKA